MSKASTGSDDPIAATAADASAEAMPRVPPSGTTVPPDTMPFGNKTLVVVLGFIAAIAVVAIVASVMTLLGGDDLTAGP